MVWHRKNMLYKLGTVSVEFAIVRRQQVKVRAGTSAVFESLCNYLAGA